MLERGHAHDAASFSALVTAYEKAGDWQGALRTFERMRSIGLVPTSFTYRCAIFWDFRPQLNNP